MRQCVFSPADILLPQDCDYDKWAVVACDQYTSQPDYWQRVEETVGQAPSALRLILPESCLDGPNVETDIVEVNNTMSRYLREGRFRELPNAMIYVERRLRSGAVRRGVVGKVDLEAYDYEPGAKTPIRATEGTVMARIPPRVAVRKNAPLELPHVLMLCDDPERTVVEPLSARKAEFQVVYDFDLMEGGGHLTGYLLPPQAQEAVCAALDALLAKSAEENGPDNAMLLAAGDGNHSLATAKECYERQKRLVPEERWDGLAARYALAELGNLWDESLEFEPIHRLVTGCAPEAVLRALIDAFPGAYFGTGEGHVIQYAYGGKRGSVTVPRPAKVLEVETLQPFLDRYLATHSGAVDYIHGSDVAEELSREPGSLAFLLPPMDKRQLFPAVIAGGMLPRKTFSMGEAHDKRFYLEARKIR